MYKQSVELLGGIYDQDGKITMLDHDGRNKAQAIATEATKIWQREGGTRTDAVAKAARKFGLDIKKPPVANPADPNNIRNFLTR